MQSAAIFPVTDSIEDLGTVLQWMTDGGQGEAGRAIWQKARKVSADEISAYANLRRLFAQREVFRKENWSCWPRTRNGACSIGWTCRRQRKRLPKGESPCRRNCRRGLLC